MNKKALTNDDLWGWTKIAIALIIGYIIIKAMLSAA